MRIVCRGTLLLGALALSAWQPAFGIAEVVVTGELPKFFNYSPFGQLPVGIPGLDPDDVAVRHHYHPVRAKPASQDNSKKDCGTPTTKNPVIVATGEKYKTEPDFSGGGRYALGLERTYRSKQASGVLFGPNWLSNLDPARITASAACTRRFANWPCAPDSFTLTEPDGTKYKYTYKSYSLATGGQQKAARGGDEDGAADQGEDRPSGAREGRAQGGAATENAIGGESDVPQAFIYTVNNNAATGSLTYSLDGVTTLRRGKLHYIFESGRLVSVSDGETGERLTYAYTAEAAPKLQSVTNLVGQSVRFIWNGNRVSEVRDPAGNAWIYRYDGNGMLTSVTSPGAAQDVRSYHYEDARRDLLTGISINGVRYSTYSYHVDASRRVWTSALAGGEEKDTVTYGDKVTQVVDARGQATIYRFVDVKGELLVAEISRGGTSTCPAAAAYTVYDLDGYVDFTLDWNGNKTDLTYDSSGKLSEATTAAGTAQALTTQYRWSGDDIDQLTYLNAARAPYLRINIGYHPAGTPAAGRPAHITRTDLQTGEARWTNYGYEFHPNGALAAYISSVALPNGETALTTTRYDTLGNTESVTNPVGHTESWSEYTGLGQPRLHLDANGVATRYTYNPTGTVATLTETGKGTTRIAYNHDRQPTTVTSPDGQVARFTYNAGGRLEYVGNALSEYVRLAMPSPVSTVETSTRRIPSWSGNALTATASGQFSKATQLDSLGRNYTVTGNAGQRVDFRYDPNGNLRTRTDRLGYTTTYEYDAQQRARKVIAPDGAVTELVYDSAGRLQHVIDPRGLRTTYTYNAFGDRLTSSSPDTGLIQAWYDIGGRKYRERFNDGKVVDYQYDPLGRLILRSSAPMGEQYIYDQGSYGKGRLTAITDWTGRTDFAYDAAGRLVQQDNDIYGGKHRTVWRYDSVGRFSGMTYPTGLTLTYDYDAYGRLSAIRSNMAGTWSTLASSFLYQPATNERFGWRFGNARPRMLTFDTDRRLAKIATPGTHQLDFGYHQNDTLATVNDGMFPVLNSSYFYDRADRLVEAGARATPRPSAGTARATAPRPAANGREATATAWTPAATGSTAGVARASPGPSAIITMATYRANERSTAVPGTSPMTPSTA